jgi:hypothetical protein
VQVNDTLTSGQHFVDRDGLEGGVMDVAKKSKKSKKNSKKGK